MVRIPDSFINLVTALFNIVKLVKKRPRTTNDIRAKSFIPMQISRTGKSTTLGIGCTKATIIFTKRPNKGTAFPTQTNRQEIKIENKTPTKNRYKVIKKEFIKKASEIIDQIFSNIKLYSR